MRRAAIGPVLAPLLLAPLLLAACAVGDDYARPDLALPGSFRGASADGAALGVRDWRSVFTDPSQQAWIEATLAGNLDLRVAQA